MALFETPVVKGELQRGHLHSIWRQLPDFAGGVAILVDRLAREEAKNAVKTETATSLPGGSSGSVDPRCQTMPAIVGRSVLASVLAT